MLQSFFRPLTWYIHDLLARIQFHRTADKHSGLLFNGNVYGSYTRFPAACALNLEMFLYMDKVFITRIEWCKINHSPFHEFLVVYVQERSVNDDQMPRRSVIAIDRNVGNLKRKSEDNDKDEIVDGTEELVFKKPDGTIMPPPADALLRTATVAYGSEWANLSSRRETLSDADNLYFTNDGTASFITNIQNDWFDHKVCRTLDIVGEHFSVSQLVLLTSIAHNHWRTYRFSDYQCFWLAHVVYTTISSLVPMAGNRGKSGWYEVDHKRSFSVGQFRISKKSTPFNVQRVGTGETVKNKYLVAWQEYKKEITAYKAKKVEEYIAVSTASGVHVQRLNEQFWFKGQVASIEGPGGQASAGK